MASKIRKTAEMNLYQRIHHAARNNKAADEILKLCRVPVDAIMSADTEHGPQESFYTDAVIALWAVAARLHDAERAIETLKRRSRRERQRTSGKPQPELLKKEAPQNQTDIDPEDNEMFLHSLEKND